MEVGRVGDLRIWDGSIVRLPLVGDGLYRWLNKNLSKKERLKANCASRWSAVGRMVVTTNKHALTRAGLLMEVVRDTPEAKFSELHSEKDRVAAEFWMRIPPSFIIH